MVENDHPMDADEQHLRLCDNVTVHSRDSVSVRSKKFAEVKVILRLRATSKGQG